MVKRLLSKLGKPQLDSQNLHKRLGVVTWSVTSHGGGGGMLIRELVNQR